MAIAYDSVSPDTSTAAGASTLTSGAFTISGSDRLLIGVTAAAAASGRATHSGMKWRGSGGTALTQIGSTLDVGTGGRLSTWRLIAPDAVSDTIYGLLSDSDDEVAIGGVSYTGVDQTTPVGTPVTNTGTIVGSASGNMTATVTTTAGDLVVAVFWLVATSAANPDLTPNGTPTPTGRYDIETTQLGFEALQVQEVVATGTSTTVSCQYSSGGSFSGDWGVIAFVVNASGGTQITPGLGQLTLTGQQPTALRSGDYQISTEQAIFNLQSSIPEHIKTSKEPPSPVASDGTATTVGAATTAWSINFPAASIGDMIVAIIAWDDSTTVTSVTAPAGPNSEAASSIVGPQASASTEMRMQAWRWIATGSWSAGQRTFSAAAAETCNAYVFKIAKGRFDPNTPIGASSSRASAGTAESAVLSPSFSVGSTDGDGRLLIAYGSDADAITAPASGTTTLRNNTSGGVGFCVVTRDAYLTNSESLTATTATIASDSWASLAFVLRAPDNPIVHVPGEGRLSLVGYEPTVSTASGSNPNIASGLGQLTLTGFAPDVIVPVFIDSGLGELVLTGFAPSIGGDLSVSSGLGELTITGYAPSLTVASGIVPGVGQLVITGYEPSQTLTLPSPAAAALVITGLAPTVNLTVSAFPGLGQLTITGLVPTLSVTENVFIDAGLGQLTLEGFAPQIGDSPTISSGLGELVITGLVPTVSVTEHQFITSGLGELQITGLAPEVREQLYISLGIEGLTLTGYAPTLQEDTGANINTGLGELLINGYAPTIEGADEERRTTGVPGRSFQFLIYINGKPHYGTHEEISELIEELAEKDAEQPKKPRTRIVVQQGKPILKGEPKPTKAELMQVQTNLRDYYLEVYAKIKLKEMEDDEDFLLLL